MTGIIFKLSRIWYIDTQVYVYVVLFKITMRSTQ